MLSRYISRNLSIGVFSVGSAIALSTYAPLSSAIAQSTTQPTCPGHRDIATATTTRVVEFPSLGTKVTIPTNFRTLLYNDGTIAILHPVDFNLIQCLTLGLPVMGTDAIRAKRFRIIPNSEGLSLEDYAANLTMDGFTLSETKTMKTSQGIQVVMRQATDQSRFGLEIAYAWYQPEGVDGIVEVSTSTEAELIDVLNQVQLLTSAS